MKRECRENKKAEKSRQDRTCDERDKEMAKIAVSNKLSTALDGSCEAVYSGKCYTGWEVHFCGTVSRVVTMFNDQLRRAPWKDYSGKRALKGASVVRETVKGRQIIAELQSIGLKRLNCRSSKEQEK